MKRYFIAGIFIMGAIFGKNDYPIVLIHGFLGWGPDEMGGYKYWGGKDDIADLLRQEGHTVFEVSVGPVSSNWDRAVEAYTQLKGGQVDYGKAHSEKFGLIQKPEGKTFVGLYPEWDENHPVHIIGHSMGGQTARVLQYLLASKIYEDQESTIFEKSPLLGQVNLKWIHSITTIATPHNGTTMAELVTNTFPFVQYFVGLAGVVGTRFYDFDLEQWNLTRKANESWSSYVSRMRTHPAWETKNISSWDASLDGAKAMNNYAVASADIFYFSILTSITEKNADNHFHSPVRSAPLLIRARAKILGTKVGYWQDGTNTDSTWYENDGLVNTCSMAGPTTGTNGPDTITPLVEKDVLISGQWYTIGPLKMNHWNIIGHKLMLGNLSETAMDLYKSHALRLSMLPIF
ncbi:MAG: lipase [Candidatus Marinimicrobia bacterium]|jgi:triacylglycerol lipase|nr:lipase [Candidatus Neomarinimicrobiota bacterium]HJM33809.1 lipase [Candidatus Neomarinimicrobiota bacterium]|tara:strand:+ start:3246 stop:4454 length:1209 start_codon:yes stop_codon:yes gene_type:complete